MKAQVYIDLRNEDMTYLDAKIQVAGEVANEFTVGTSKRTPPIVGRKKRKIVCGEQNENEWAW